MAIWKDIANLISKRYEQDETFTKDEIIGEAILADIVQNTIKSNTWKALIDHQVILADSDDTYIRNPEYTTTSDTKSNDKHNKKNNQDFGKYFEFCISEISKGATTPPNWEHCTFTDKVKQEVFEHAAMMRNYLGKDEVFNWTGKNTMTAIGDLVDENGEKIEVKYINGDSGGTYFNNTMYSLLRYNPQFDVRKYLHQYDLYNLSEQLFGDLIPISRSNKSPVGNRHPNLKLITSSTDSIPEYKYKFENIYKPRGQEAMAHFTSDIYDFFIENPDKFAEFFDNLLNKRKEEDLKNNVTSSAPDRYVCFNYYTKKIHEVDMLAFKNHAESSYNLRKNDTGIIVNDFIRINFSWKNGLCLSNPAIYVFPLKNGEI